MANRNRHTMRYIFPGERWLYLKIYGGVNMCDILLVNTIYPLIKSLLRHGLITRWFFIRYGDPKFHLRVRVELKDEERLALVLQSFNKKLLPLCRQRRLYKVVVDTYERELERYGVGLMDVAETLFDIDSHCVCNLLQSDQASNRWQLAFVWIDKMLNALGYPLERKHDLIARMSKGYLNEFGYNEHNIKSLANRYRQLRQPIANLLSAGISNVNYQKAMNNSLKRIAKALYEHDLSIINVTSLLHMSMNRLFASQNRLNELVIYYCLEKHYQTEIKKHKKL